MKLKALRDITVEGIHYKAGDILEVTNSFDVQDLLDSKLAEPAEDESE
jgi:hypothetical protein